MITRQAVKNSYWKPTDLKADLAEFKADLAEFKLDILKWMIPFFMTNIGLVIVVLFKIN